jgi:hypothetical protein
MRKLALLIPLALTSCGPIPVQQAERQCLDRARLAQQPRGEVGIGIGTGGRAVSNIEINVSSDFILGRDPSAVFATCVMQKSGQAPTRSLSSFPEWKG